MIMKLMECVPNFSEGRDHAVLEQISNVIKECKGIEIIYQDLSKNCRMSQ